MASIVQQNFSCQVKDPEIHVTISNESNLDALVPANSTESKWYLSDSIEYHAIFALLLATVIALLGIKVLLSQGFKNARAHGRSSLPTPPVVNIPADVLLTEAGHEAITKALDQFGDVVLIPRLGRKEYILEHQHVNRVLTDSNHFSFEDAVLGALRLQWLTRFRDGAFVRDMDKLVQDGVTPRLKAVVSKVAPVFVAEMATLRSVQGQNTANELFELTDVYHWVHKAIAHAMVILILGEEYVSDEMIQAFTDIVASETRMFGMYQNTDAWRRFPRLWSIKTALTELILIIIPTFIGKIFPAIWRNRSVHCARAGTAERNEFSPFFDLLVARYRSKQTGSLGFGDLMWCCVLSLGVVFASVHQSAVVCVWCVMTLVQKQDDYLPALRKEWNDVLPKDASGQRKIDIDALNKLTLLDSFIKEVMRSKGDAYTSIRRTTRDTQVGPYIIPKGSTCLVYVKRAHEHPDNYGDTGKMFDGFRWHREARPAAQSTPSNISFGLGRWTCPGRFLAVAEIKMAMLALFLENDIRLKPETYRVTDPMNTTSVAPKGVLQLLQRSRSDSASQKPGPTRI